MNLTLYKNNICQTPCFDEIFILFKESHIQIYSVFIIQNLTIISLEKAYEGFDLILILPGNLKKTVELTVNNSIIVLLPGNHKILLFWTQLILLHYQNCDIDLLL